MCLSGTHPPRLFKAAKHTKFSVHCVEAKRLPDNPENFLRSNVGVIGGFTAIIDGTAEIYTAKVGLYELSVQCNCSSLRYKNLLTA
jgi:hypothetical protein